MPDESLFSKHLRIVSGEPLSESDREEFERLNNLRLPPLKLEPRPISWWRRHQFRLQASLAAAVTAAVVLVVLPRNQDDRLTPKGSVQVNVYWERAGKVSPLTKDSALTDGDRIGASVNSSEESVAYWAITDNQFNVIGGLEDMESGKLNLEPGLAKSFNSSFALVSPNQGEHLVVVVCPKAEAKSGKPLNSLLDHNFVSQLMGEQRMRSSNCMFIGYRLRSLP